MRSACVVTLVHGTWAQNAAWTKTTSPLVEALRRNLGDGVQLEPFQWSGRNWHFSRSRAATALRQHIQGCSERYLGADQFVIAHSHGGNVALYALRDPEVRREVRGTVCLSTPFIYCRRRALGQGGLLPVAIFFLSLYIWLLSGPMERLIPGSGMWQIRGIVEMLPLALLWLVFFLVLRGVSPALLQKGPSGVLSDLFESFRLPDLEPDELFVARAPGDEASSGLGATPVFSLLLGYVSRTFGRLYAAGEWLCHFHERLTWRQRFRKFLTFFFAGLVAIAPTWAANDLLGLSALSFILFLAAISLIFVGALFLVPYTPGVPFGLPMIGFGLEAVAGGLLLPVIVLLSLVTTPFGIDAGLLAPFFELSAEATPPGSFHVFQTRDSALPGLRHSYTYSDDATLDTIVKWIADQGRRRRRHR